MFDIIIIIIVSRGAGMASTVERALASHQCGLGSIPTRCHMWVEFVVVSHSCSEGLPLGSPVFVHSLLRNQQRSKFQFDLDKGPT